MVKEKLSEILHSRWLRICGAIISTIIMLLLVFLGDRSMQSLGGEGTSMQHLHLVELILKGESLSIPDRYLAVNIGYDRELVDISDDYGMPVGNTDITDRRHLAMLLDSLRGLNYSAIVLDVNLDTRYRSPHDSMLMAAIGTLPRIVVSAHTDVESMVDNSKTGLADYSTNMSDNNFTKYPYIIDGCESVALKTFRMAGGESDIAAGKFSFEQPVVYLMLPITGSSPYDEEGEKTWYNLGTDILHVYDRETLGKLVDERIIVIGDYCNADIHNTYAGDISGPIILINAIEALEHRDNVVKPLSVMLMAAVYLLLNLFLASGKSLWDVVPWKMPRILQVIAGMMSYTVVLLLLSVIQFAVFDEFHDAFLVSLWLTGYYFLFNYINEHYPTGNAIKPT